MVKLYHIYWHGKTNGPYLENDQEILVDLSKWRAAIMQVVNEDRSTFRSFSRNFENIMDEFLYDWCEQRGINLLWHVPDYAITSGSFAGSQYPYMRNKSLLVFSNPQDKMLFKLYHE